MRKTQQTRVAIIGTLFFIVCTVGVAVAEGEPPVISPDVPSPLSTPTAEQVDPPAETATPEAETAVSDEPAATPTVDPATWMPVINSLRPGYWEASILPVQGMAMYYNPGVFTQVMEFRYKSNHISECDECIGYVAMLRGGDIDRRVWIQRAGHEMEGPFWVVDAAAGQHISSLLSRQWVADVDHETAMRWRMSGPVWVTIYDADSPDVQAAVAAQASAAQTYALVGFLYKCAILPLETNNYQVLDALADSAACLTSSQAEPPPAQGETDTVDAEKTND